MRITQLFCLLFFSLSFTSLPKQEGKEEWISLFDGKTLNGWKVGTNAETFKVQDGGIIVNGKVAHLFYDGAVANHNFTNFELKLDIMTKPGANSGVYIHTLFQESSWPKKGYEVQVNNSQTDWRRTASLYAIQDLKEVFVKDDEWFTMHIIVKGKNIQIKINDQLVNDYTESENAARPKGMEERLLSSGTIALQGHDPNSIVLYKNIRVKIL